MSGRTLALFCFWESNNFFVPYFLIWRKYNTGGTEVSAQFPFLLAYIQQVNTLPHNAGKLPTWIPDMTGQNPVKLETGSKSDVRNKQTKF